MVTLYHEIEGHMAHRMDDSDPAFDRTYEKPVEDAVAKAKADTVDTRCYKCAREASSSLSDFIYTYPFGRKPWPRHTTRFEVCCCSCGIPLK